MNIPNFAEVLLLLSLALLAIEFTDWFPRLAEAMIRFLTSHLPADKSDTRRKEWLALLDDIPGNYAKLLYSFSFIPAVLIICKVKFLGTIFGSFLLLIENFLLAFLEYFKVIYFSLILVIFPVIIIIFLICLPLCIQESDYSLLFSIIYCLLFMMPSISSITQGEATHGLLDHKFKLPRLWLIKPQYLNLWFSAKIFSLIGIIQFDTNNISHDLNLFGVLYAYLLLWSLAKRYSESTNNIILS